MLPSEQKSAIVYTTTECFITLAYRGTQFVFIPSVLNIKCYILPTLQNHNYINGSNGGAIGWWLPKIASAVSVAY